MQKLALVLVLAMASGLSVGCADKRITLKYQPPGTLEPMAPSQTITIYNFNDRRGEEGDGDPARVGGIYGGYGNRLSKVLTEGPFMPTFVNALADGFKARGLTVTVIPQLYTPTSPRPGTVLTGDLKNFSAEARYTNSAHISSIVRIYSPDGTMLLEKELSERVRSDQGGGGGVLTDVKDLERIMNETLEKFVQRIVTDPDITARLSGR